MLKEKEIFKLLKIAVNKYITKLESMSFDALEYGAEAKAYMKVLNHPDFQYKFLSIDRARTILDKIEKLNL